MSVFKHIKEAKFQIELLKTKLQTVTNLQQQTNLVNLINSFITLLNDCESLLAQNINTDVIDKLLLARIYSQMFGCDNDAVNIQSIIERIETNLIEPKGMQKRRIVEFLIQKEITNIITELPYETNNGYSKLTATANEKTTAFNKLKKITTAEEYDGMIEEMLNNFKQTIQWN